MNGVRSEFYAAERLYHGAIARVMGTRFDLLLVSSDPETSSKVWSEITATLERLERMLDRFDPNSEVSRLNATPATQAFRCSPELDLVLRLCGEYYEKTDRIFDVTRCDFSKTSHRGDRLFGRGEESLTLDFGGFAKGYALREIERLLRTAGVESAFVDFGNSSILALGHHPYGDCWKVEVVDPYTRQPLREFRLRDRALSTSGNTPHYEGHIINPQIHSAVREPKMAVIAASDVLDAEVLSTVWMIADAEQQNHLRSRFQIAEEAVFKLENKLYDAQ